MVKISEIAAQNPWWTQGVDFRLSDKHLSQARPVFFERKGMDFKPGNIYTLRGCRQVGKTTYLKDTIRILLERGISPRHIMYLSLDFFTSRREMRNTINYFLETSRDVDRIYLFMDEVTSVPDWNLELKYMADRGITRKAIIIATGSSAAGLKREGELLPGRGLEGNEYYLKPLTFRDFSLQLIPDIINRSLDEELLRSLINLQNALKNTILDTNGDIAGMRQIIDTLIPFNREMGYLFKIYLTTGGFPGVINHYLIQRFEKKEETIDSSLAEILVRQVLGDFVKQNKQEIMVRQILKEIIAKYGTRYSFSTLARDVEMAHSTTIDYLELLKGSFVVFTLYPYDFNKKEQKFKGDKKICFLDPFIYYSFKSHLTGVELWKIIQNTLAEEEVISSIVEGIVSNHLLVSREIPYMREGGTFLWFHYGRNGKEIDNILKQAKKSYLGIEVKYQREVDTRDILRVSPVKDYLLLSREDVGRGKGVLVIPVSVFLALLPTSSRNL
jgi:hypothetical protein